MDSTQVTSVTFDSLTLASKHRIPWFNYPPIYLFIFWNIVLISIIHCQLHGQRQRGEKRGIKMQQRGGHRADEQRRQLIILHSWIPVASRLILPMSSYEASFHLCEEASCTAEHPESAPSTSTSSPNPTGKNQYTSCRMCLHCHIRFHTVVSAYISHSSQRRREDAEALSPVSSPWNHKS